MGLVSNFEQLLGMHLMSTWLRLSKNDAEYTVCIVKLEPF